MREIAKYILIVILLTLCVDTLFAQSYNTDSYAQQQQQSNIAQNEGPADSLGGKKKDPKDRKPLESYLFADSLKQKRIFAWTYNPYTNRVKQALVDTVLNNFNREYFFQDKEGMGSLYLGNLGAPTTPVEYSDRYQDYNLSFLNPYKEYLFTPSNALFFNSKVAYSQFSYITSGQSDRAEEIFDLTHAQNISPTSGFNLNYRNNRTRGMYENQQSINKNFSLVFSHTGKRYTTHFGYVFNSGDMRENGGITNVSEVLDTIIDPPQNITINLTDAKTRFKGNGFFYTQSLAIPLSYVSSEYDSLLNLLPDPLSSLDSLKLARRRRVTSSEVATGRILFVGTTVEYDSYKKIYTDSRGEVTEDDYYQHWYINSQVTRDSIRETNLNMMLFAQLQPFNSTGVLSLIGGGVGYANNGYYYFRPEDYLSGGGKVQKKSVFVYGDAQGQWSRYMSWNGHVKYFPVGYRSQDIEAGGNLTLAAYTKNKKPIMLKGDINFRSQSPSYWDTEFYSNHYKWNNDFSNEVRTDIEVKLIIPSIHLEVGVNQLLSTNTIYYNANALPTQFDDALSVTSLYLKKNFVFGGLHLNHKLLYQTSSNQEVAPVPELAVDLQYLYRFTVVAGVLEMEVGVNGRYTTEYYGLGYNPAISQFYNQRTLITGGYPTLDVFATGKWKRLRFIVKMENLNNELFGGRNNFDIASYPHNRRMLKYGISWSFYN